MSSKYIPYSRQNIDEGDINAVIQTLRSDHITQGPKIKEFEEDLAAYCGAKYAVVFSSGTAALHAAYFVVGISQKDELITSPITFLATTNAALFLGAKPVFVDVEMDTGNIDAALIERSITKRTKAIVPVDYAGHPVDLERIWGIAKSCNLSVIEDACHCLGAEYKGEKIGHCKYSDMTVFSFHPVKPITTGEGGAVLTNNEEYYERLIMFRQHGVTKDSSKFKSQNSKINEGWYYEMQLLGYNYRMTDIQAALGISQLRKLDSFIERRRQIADIYRREFKENDFFSLPQEKDYVKSSWHLYSIRLKEKYKDKRREVFMKLREKGIGVQVHYIPVYWHPYYQDLGYKRGICPVAEDFYESEISIPIYPSMDEEDVKYVVESIKKTVGWEMGKNEIGFGNGSVRF